MYPHNQSRMAKVEKTKQVQIRWELPEHVYKKIGVYQRSHRLSSLEQAGRLLLEKVTEEIILAEK